MKKIILLSILAILLSNKSFAQSGAFAFSDTIDFESSQDWIKIDTSITNNIWQIGVPSKSFFNGAYSGTKSMVTDTLYYYPLNNYSTFTLSTGGLGGNDYGEGIIGFWHKYDTSEGKDGGYIEISYDDGINWNNIVQDPYAWEFTPTNSYGITDTIEGGIPAFSGNSGTWVYSEFYWFWWAAVKSCPSCIIALRFVFQSDSIIDNKEGWIIDKININGYWAFGEIESNNYSNEYLKAYPVPAKDFFYIELLEAENFEFELFDNLGSLIMRKENNITNRLKITCNNLSPGIYYYSVISRKNNFKGKVLIK